jgi:hypothetical protein
VGKSAGLHINSALFGLDKPLSVDFGSSIRSKISHFESRLCTFYLEMVKVVAFHQKEHPGHDQ